MLAHFHLAISNSIHQSNSRVTRHGAGRGEASLTRNTTPGAARAVYTNHVTVHPRPSFVIVSGRRRHAWQVEQVDFT